MQLHNELAVRLLIATFRLILVVFQNIIAGL